jgi:hypothetical protein
MHRWRVRLSALHAGSALTPDLIFSSASFFHFTERKYDARFFSSLRILHELPNLIYPTSETGCVAGRWMELAQDPTVGGGRGGGRILTKQVLSGWVGS